MTKYKKLNINEFGDFDSKNKEYSEGVFELQLNSRSEFHNVVKILKNNTDYIWRGQSEENSLESKFDRLDSEENREKELTKTLSKLKKRLMEVRNVNSLTQDEIWAIGQHYGLDTPLLDWTESPYIAAYFAFYEKGKNVQNNRVIYALNRALKLLIKGRNRFVEFDLNNNNFDFTQNQRLVEQKGKFTKSLDGEDIGSVVGKFWKTVGRKYPGDIILMKILIPNKFRDECLQSLEHMNITHGALFPDYAGAVDICRNDLGELN